MRRAARRLPEPHAPFPRGDEVRRSMVLLQIRGPPPSCAHQGGLRHRRSRAAPSLLTARTSCRPPGTNIGCGGPVAVATGPPTVESRWATDLARESEGL